MSQSRSFGVAVVARVTGALLFAAVAATSASAQVSDSASAARPLSLQAELKSPLDLSLLPDSRESDPAAGSSSSSSGETSLPLVALGADLSSAVDGGGQPPPYRRRRYGRPNYNDRLHNSDGSNRLAFVLGAGFTVPAGATGRQNNLNYALKGGAGINFSRKLGALVEFNFDRFGVQGSVLNQQYAIYNSLGITDSSGSPVDFSGLDATSYVWSITLNPTLTFYEGEKFGAYAVVGGGYYHKVTNFSLPQTGVGYDYFYGYYNFQTQQTFDHYANNAGGVNGGIGLTYKLSRFSNQRLFAEARYVYVFNSNDTNSANSLYPQANARTSYFPVTVGVRF